MADNMALWNTLRTPPANALKPIEAGRLRGKSDINPQWRYEALTSALGPCGNGWWFTVNRLWTEPGADGEVMAFADVTLFVKGSEHGIPGIGGSALIAKERNGMYNNDEAYKMAVTDALGTAGKMLGLAADIYRGTSDGSKYVPRDTAPAPAPAPRKPATVASTVAPTVACVTPEQAATIRTEVGRRIVDLPKMLASVKATSIDTIPAAAMGAIMAGLEKKPMVKD